MTYDTPQFDHPVRNQLSSDALEWYDEKTLERDLTRDEFHMFILEVIDSTALAAGSQLEALTKERDKLKEAAKLALEALDEAQTYAYNVGKALDEAQKYTYNVGKYMHNVPQAIETLKQAGVQ